jgi:hypothetical protein
VSDFCIVIVLDRGGGGEEEEEEEDLFVFNRALTFENFLTVYF